MVASSDPAHRKINEWLDSNNEPLLTTDYIVDETLTLLRARNRNDKAVLLGTRFFESDMTTVHFLSNDDIREAWAVFTAFDDKAWSFTDCSSRVIMNKFGITKAVSLDRHFAQFGTITVLP